VSAVLGVALGVPVGLALVWLFGVYRTVGLGPENAAKLIASTSLVFGLLGLALGSHAGTWVGEFIRALFEMESAYDRPRSGRHVPGWLVVMALVGVVVAVFAYTR
jgi:hypothetical protein